MAIVFQDSFTDVNGTLLQNHTPEIGGPWTKISGQDAVITSVPKRLYVDGVCTYSALLTISTNYQGRIAWTAPTGITSPEVNTFIVSTSTGIQLFEIQLGNGIHTIQLYGSSPITFLAGGSSWAYVFDYARQAHRFIVDNFDISLAVNFPIAEFTSLELSFASPSPGAHWSISDIIFEIGEFLPLTLGTSFGSSGSGSGGRSGIYDHNRRLNNDGTW